MGITRTTDILLDAVVLVLSSAPAWLALRSIIKTFVDRHKDKRIRIDGLDVRGYSLKDAQRLIDQLQEQNVKNEKAWKARLQRERQLVPRHRTLAR